MAPKFSLEFPGHPLDPFFSGKRHSFSDFCANMNVVHAARSFTYQICKERENNLYVYAQFLWCPPFELVKFMTIQENYEYNSK